MTSIQDSIKHDLHKDPRELEREADSARTHLERTLEALEDRLSPGAMADQVMRAVRRNGGEFGSNLATQVRNNPLPTLLVSAGLTWLMASSKSAPERTAGRNGGPSVGERASSAVGSAKHAAGRLSERTRGTAAGVRESAGEAAGAMRDAGSRLAHSTRSGAQELRDGWSYMNREHPLVLGALAVAAGAAMAAWLPPTETEDEWLGEASDDAKARASEELKHRADQAKDAAADMADSARKKAGDTGESEDRPAARRP